MKQKNETIELLKKHSQRIEEIKNIQPQSYTLKDVTKREAKSLFQNFAPVEKIFMVDFFESKDIEKKPRKEASSIKNVTLSVSFPNRTLFALQ